LSAEKDKQSANLSNISWTWIQFLLFNYSSPILLIIQKLLTYDSYNIYSCNSIHHSDTSFYVSALLWCMSFSSTSGVFIS